MPVPFRCSCGFQANVKDELQGKKIKCPQCKTPGVVGGGKGASGKSKKEKEDPDALLNLNLDAFSNEEIETIDPAVAKKQKALERKQKAREERRKNSLGTGVILACC